MTPDVGGYTLTAFAPWLRITISPPMPGAGRRTPLPAAAVVTTTADPQQQGGKNKNKNGDTSHTPGEDGSGNSAG